MNNKSLNNVNLSMISVFITIVLFTLLSTPKKVHITKKKNDLFGQTCEPYPQEILTSIPKPEILDLFKHNSPLVSKIVNKTIAYNARDASLILAIISVESSGRVDAVSSVGARGLMQLMPTTAEWIAGKYNIPYYKGVEFDPEWNVKVGIIYIEYLVEKYMDYEHALTAYHRGPYNTTYILNKYGELPPHVKSVYSDLVISRME